MQIGVLGCGVMGRQLVALFATAGHDAIVWDVEGSPKFEKEAERSVRLFGRQRGMDKSAIREISERIRYATELGELESCELVLEAVKEDKIVKKEALSRLAQLVEERSIIATNTSSLSIGELSESVTNPERFLGLHFFNPVVSIELVEVIRGPYTSEQTVTFAANLLSDVGKKGLIVPDMPGFVVNHLLLLMINEAIYLLEREDLTAETVDACMRLAAGHAMGPLELADLCGLDTCLAVLEHLHRRTGNQQYRPAPMLRRYVREGRLGRKSGGGFYPGVARKAA
jgi:3-hydroxybutyryl-CoA dehydrogenase